MTLENGKTNYAVISFVVLGIIIALWIGNFVVLDYYLPSPEVRGQTGDSFGAVNSLYSGLAFAGVIIAILLQRQELILQRKELRATREESERSRKQLESHSESFQQQIEDNRFFQLLANHEDLISNLQIQEGQNAPLTGRAVFSHFWSCLWNSVNAIHYEKKKAKQDVSNAESVDEFVQQYEQRFYNYARSLLSSYYGSLETLVEFACHASSSQALYASIIAKRMSDYEGLLLLYYCLSPICSPQLARQVCELSVLVGIPRDLMIDPNDLLNLNLKYCKPSQS